MRPQVALRLLLAVLLAGLGLAACGGGDDNADRSAAELIERTFGSDAPVRSGRLSIRATADLRDRGAFELDLSARFSEASEGQLPKLDGTLAIASDGGDLRAGAISTGDRGFLVVAGQAYAVPQQEYAAFTRRYLASQREADKRRGAQPTLSGLGIHPETWLIDPRKEGEREIAGVETYHLTAGVDVGRMLDDVAKLLERNGAGRQLGDAEMRQVRRGVRSARVEVDTGTEDLRLRRLVIQLELRSGTVDLIVEYADLDEPQEITAPSDSRPLSELTDALAGATGGAQAPQGGAGASDRYAQCLQDAGGDLAKAQACAKYL